MRKGTMTADTWYIRGRLLESLSDEENQKVWHSPTLSIEEIRAISDGGFDTLNVVQGFALLRHRVSNELHIADFRSFLGSTTPIKQFGLIKPYHRRYNAWKYKQLEKLISQHVGS